MNYYTGKELMLGYATRLQFSLNMCANHKRQKIIQCAVNKYVNLFCTFASLASSIFFLTISIGLISSTGATSSTVFSLSS